ncbi:MAG TPA: wax ester/triacylglycerol synthase family O-acyltransferase [Candidatus Angelobacter sp.]|nr:wax ester/triacylglycerol synthase family O-acyltransferase [Candidatus Angelobacter sp.]
MAAGSIDRLRPLDRFMLRVSRTWPQDIAALAILDGEPLLAPGGELRLDDLRDAIRRRLHLVPRFRQIIVEPRRGLGPPYWADAREVDMAAHIRAVPLPAEAGASELLQTVEELRRRRLDPSRPMWEMWFLTGLSGGRVAWLVKLNHAMGDGMAAMAAISSLLDTSPRATADEPPSWQPARRPLPSELVADNLRTRVRALTGQLVGLSRPWTLVRRALAAWPAAWELLGEPPATRTSLDRMIGIDRRLAIVRTSLDGVRAVARAHDATVNDVLLAATAAGARALLRHRGERVEGVTLRSYVPVSLRRRLRGLQQGNLIGQMAVPLDLGQEDPDRRLRQIARETGARKRRLRTSLEALMHGGAVGRRLMLGLVMRQRVNLATTSIPGPKHPLFLAGAPVLEVYPILPLVANEPIGIGALSYAGELAFGIIADRDVVPDLDVFVDAVRGELPAARTLAVSPLVGAEA